MEAEGQMNPKAPIGMLPVCVVAALAVRVIGLNELVPPLLLVWIGAWLFLRRSPTGGWIRLESGITAVTCTGILLHLVFEFSPIRGPRIVETLSWLLLVLASLGSGVSRSHLGGFRQLRFFCAFVIVCVSCWIAITFFTLESKIRLLGLGYDNYGHIASARVVAAQSRSFLTERSDSIVTVITDTPQAAAATLALVARLVGATYSLPTFINLYVFVTLLMPITFVWLLVQTAWSTKSRARALIFIASAVLTLTMGHFGRIWVSGFFASNFATLFSCLAIHNLVASKWLRLRQIPLQVVILANLWPMMAITFLGCVIMALFWRAAAAPGAMKVDLEKWLGRSWQIRGVDVAFALMTPTVLAVWLAMRRSFVPGSYWNVGGMEAPSILATLIGLLALALMALSLEFRASTPLPFGMATLSVGCAVILLSVFGRGELTYYPIKILVAITCMAITVAAFGNKKESPLVDNATVIRGLATAALVVCFSFTQTFWYSERSIIFRGGYMGRIDKAVISWSQSEDQVVDAKTVSRVFSSHLRDTDGVLYLSDRFESELNTRWINTVRWQWTDTNWERWHKLRQLISDGEYAEADTQIVESKMTVLVEGTFAGITSDGLRKSLPLSSQIGRICAVPSQGEIECLVEN